jgi:UPF0755 protein
LIVALVLVGTVALSASYVLTRPLNISDTEYLLIKRGDSLGSLAGMLTREGWLASPQVMFQAYGRMTLARGHIKAGEYQVDPGMTPLELLTLVRSGNVVQRTVTFPEGWTVSQWLEHLSNNELLIENDQAVAESILSDLSKWEGRLYPDTYAYTRGESSVDILNRAKQKMNQMLVEIWASRSVEAAVTSAEEALILASVIEKETGYEPDRPLVASVFNNRLIRGMKLQSDPTVIYGLANFDGDLRRRHLKLDHPYNTYVHKGLPAGPICNPGLASLKAAVDPPASPYYYFVAQGDGRSYFSTNLDEHRKAVNQYQKTGRVKDYRSAPAADSN